MTVGPIPCTPYTLRGTALVEALVAAALLGMGLLGASRLALHTLAHAREARAQLQAQSLAHEALDCALTAQPICPTSPVLTLNGWRYQTTLTRSSLEPTLQELQVTVVWSPPDSQAPADALRRLSWRTRQALWPDAGHGALGVSSP